MRYHSEGKAFCIVDQLRGEPGDPCGARLATLSDPDSESEWLIQKSALLASDGETSFGW